jgi:hypothetical protein
MLSKCPPGIVPGHPPTNNAQSHLFFHIPSPKCFQTFVFNLANLIGEKSDLFNLIYFYLTSLIIREVVFWELFDPSRSTLCFLPVWNPGG